MNNSNFVVEFLSETNLILAQFDSGNKLYELLQPVKNLFLNEKKLLSYSICRYNGGSPQLSFFCEWYYQICRITDNPELLKVQNQIYFSKKLSPKLKNLDSVEAQLAKDIDKFTLAQISILHSKTRELNDLAMRKHQSVIKYLDYNYVNKFFGNQYQSRKALYQDITIAEFLDSKGGSLAYTQIVLPFLIGAMHGYTQSDSIINPESIKWVLLEEVLRNIAILYEINLNHEFEEFLMLQSLDEEAKVEWYQLDAKNQFQKLISNTNIREQFNQYRQKLIDNINLNIDMIKLPQESKEILVDLYDWAKQTK
jgi:hypothetical protein